MPIIRRARSDDLPAVAAFTEGTFTWGDYVAERFDDWVTDPDGAAFVAVGDEDRAIALGYVQLLSPDEAWGQGARVHPDHRRQGLATLISESLWAWAADRGARVVRLAVEDWNEAALAQVGGMGFRKVGAWQLASRAVGDASPVPEGNGGRRVPVPERLRRVPSSEADPAYLSWSSGALSHAARELYAVGWQWRRLRPDDLVEAARLHALWEGRPGWAMAEPRRQALAVSWLQTAPEDAYAMARALVDLAADGGHEQLRVMAPSVDWLRRGLRRAGCSLSPIGVFARSL